MTGQTTNTGKSYESLTEQVFHRLLSQEKCVDVQRDIIIQGRSTSYQIDVAFSFAMGPVRYLTIVECKDWGSKVKQEQVLAFRAKLDDIPGQPRGIMVSRSGFQDGAREVASSRGILLYELREPQVEDWGGRVKEIHTTIRWLIPTLRNTRFLKDEDWVRDELSKRGLRYIPDDEGPESISFRFEVEGGVIRDFSGEGWDIRFILQAEIPREPCDWTEIREEFPEPLLVPTGDYRLPELKVLGVAGEVMIREQFVGLTFGLDEIVAYCFKDVLSGEIMFLGRDLKQLGGRVHGHESRALWSQERGRG